MRIGIIGAGAVGLLFAHYLGKHHEITIYTRRENQAIELNERGMNLIYNGDCLASHLKATAKSTYDEQVLLITVKQYNLQDVIEKLKEMPRKTIIFLQNGIGHLKFFSKLAHHELFVGVVEHGALKIDDRTVHHTGVGMTKFAAVHKESYLHKAFDQKDPCFPFQVEEDFHQLLMEKLIVNAAINPLTAILNCRNGELIHNKHYQVLMHSIFKEVYDVAYFKKDEQTLWNHVQSICEKTAKNESSMLKDIKAGRQTEIEAIIGSLLVKAETKGKAVPYLTFIYHAVTQLERRG